jgi:hypothetical protein
MLRVTNAESHLCKESLMLNVTYVECYSVARMPRVKYEPFAECHLC